MEKSNKLEAYNNNRNQEGEFSNYGREEDQNSAIRRSYKKHLEKLDEKFNEMLEEIKSMKERPEAFKQHTLPLARIKKIMKSDEDVKVINILYILDDKCRSSHFICKGL